MSCTGLKAAASIFQTNKKKSSKKTQLYCLTLLYCACCYLQEWVCATGPLNTENENQKKKGRDLRQRWKQCFHIKTWKSVEEDENMCFKTRKHLFSRFPSTGRFWQIQVSTQAWCLSELLVIQTDFQMPIWSTVTTVHNSLSNIFSMQNNKSIQLCRSCKPHTTKSMSHIKVTLQ